MSRRSLDNIVATILSRFEVLEIETARLVVLAKAGGDDGVLGASASLVYATVVAMGEDFKDLQKLHAAAAD